MDSRPLADRVVLVTGASRGVGAAAAEVLAEAGATVAIVARSEQALAATARVIRDDGGEVMAVPTDVTDFAAVSALVEQVTDELGGIDVLINAAGRLGPIGVPLWESDPREWAATFDADVLGILHTCRAVVPQLIDQGHGRVLNMSSPAALNPIPELGAYCVSKAAVAQLTEVLAAELEPTGVTAHSFQLGPTDSPVYREVRGLLHPGIPVDQPVRGLDLYRACELLVLLSMEEIPLPNGSMIYWDEPWVGRALSRLDGRRLLPTGRRR